MRSPVAGRLAFALGLRHVPRDSQYALGADNPDALAGTDGCLMLGAALRDQIAGMGDGPQYLDLVHGYCP